MLRSPARDDLGRERAYLQDSMLDRYQQTGMRVEMAQSTAMDNRRHSKFPPRVGIRECVNV